MGKKYHLFEVYGIELEYMLVAKSNFKVTAIVDQLLTKKNGSLTSDIENGEIAWSNELVAHVLELKTNGPTANLNNLANSFHANVVEINALLKDFDAQLLRNFGNIVIAKCMHCIIVFLIAKVMVGAMCKVHTSICLFLMMKSLKSFMLLSEFCCL